jgi:hypothetical protein
MYSERNSNDPKTPLVDDPLASGTGGSFADRALQIAGKGPTGESAVIEPSLLRAVSSAQPAHRRLVPSMDTEKLRRLVASQPTKSALMAVAAGAVAMSLAKFAFNRRRNASSHTPS